MQDKLSGKVALVTGASSGIGLAVAKKLAAQGAKVALVARTRATLDAAVAEIEAESGAGRAAAFPLDVTDFEGLRGLPRAVVERFGGLDILVNNAGVNHRGPILDRTPEEVVAVVTTNLSSPMFLTRVAVEVLRPGGVIVNVASLAGMVPVHHEAAYSASKAGLRAFTRVIAEELAERGIRVGSVCPGPVDTGFFGDIATVPNLVFSQPMSQPEAVADAVLTCVLGASQEIAVPALSGVLATLGYLFPPFLRTMRPLLDRRGAANKQRYVASKQRG